MQRGDLGRVWRAEGKTAKGCRNECIAKITTTLVNLFAPSILVLKKKTRKTFSFSPVLLAIPRSFSAALAYPFPIVWSSRKHTHCSTKLHRMTFASISSFAYLP